MTDFVLDCSVTMAWCFEDEESEYANQILESLTLPGATAVVPHLWLLEVSNVLLMQERRGRITEKETSFFLSHLAMYPIRVVVETRDDLWGKCRNLAKRHSLTVYDATYLHLAITLGVPLATLDKQMYRLMRRLKVPLFME